MLELFSVPDLWTLVFLIVAAFAAGVMDSIAGGGGLITVPALLSFGLPPTMALGTSKLQATFGSGTSFLRYSKAGLVPSEDLIPSVSFTAVGAFAGTMTVRWLPSAWLEMVIPVVLTMIFFYVLFQPKWGEQDRPPRWPKGAFYGVFGLSLGFYDGFLGPGTGSFWTVALAGLLGYGLLKATAQTKTANLTSNLVSLGVFIFLGQVLWCLGLAMGAAQMVGARLGTTVALRKGTRFIRAVLGGVVTLTLAKLIISNLWN